MGESVPGNLCKGVSAAESVRGNLCWGVCVGASVWESLIGEAFAPPHRPPVCAGEPVRGSHYGEASVAGVASE